MVKFNKNQELAVKHVNGPCMVLAGPGSGKTFVLTNRIKNLIFDEGIDPSNILVITFTRAAALEMKNRFLDLVKGEGGLFEIPTFGTFHSIFYDILKDDFGYNSESLIDNNEDKIIIYDVLAKFYKNNATESIVNNFITEVQNYKLAKEQNISYHPVNFKNGVFKKLYKEYDRKLFHSKKLRFSDMINKCYESLKDKKRVLRKYQDKYKYILIDEFQDINLSQYEIIKLICKSKNIFVVGDDDQSIYKFRGSKPSVLNDFKKDYRKAKIIYLTENYRCAKKIVQLSKKTIDFNIDRFTKNLQSNRDEIGNVEIKSFIDAKDEMEYVV
ncbi:MAG: ATP-dependent helicase, partial [Lachnospiraceae bacterium]|nr:ATP-dependent helicase [Lachnospiraceae bacterium]